MQPRLENAWHVSLSHAMSTAFFCANDQCEKADELSAGAGGGFECKYQYANYKDNLKEFHALPATVVNFSYNINIVT